MRKFNHNNVVTFPENSWFGFFSFKPEHDYFTSSQKAQNHKTENWWFSFKSKRLVHVDLLQGILGNVGNKGIIYYSGLNSWFHCFGFSSKPQEYKARLEKRHDVKNEALGHSRQAEFVRLMEQEVEYHPGKNML